MRLYVPSPTIKRHADAPIVKIDLATSVCSDDAYTLRFPSAENQYIAAFTLYLTDEDMDDLLEAIATARAARLMAQEAAYEVLRAKFAGDFANEPVEEDPEGFFRDPVDEA
jgi:hypothetical protein